MRRAAVALFSTVAGLVMLLGFKTHSVTVAGVPVATGPSAPGPGSSGTGSSDSGSLGTGSSDSGSSDSGSLGTGSSDSGSTPAAGATTAPAAGTPAASSSAAAGTPAITTKTITGDAVDTRWGPVQVQITVQNGTVTGVTAVVYPQNNPRDVQLNSYAIPQLNQEATAAKSAQIDMVSGATYTSEGYLGSLQSALNKAGL